MEQTPFDDLPQFGDPLARPKRLAKLGHIQLVVRIVDEEAAPDTKPSEGYEHAGAQFDHI